MGKKPPKPAEKLYKRPDTEALTSRGQDEGLKGMPELSADPSASQLNTLFNEGAPGCLSDSQLLERFLASGSGSGAEFDVLMARHGPMVLGVCRRILRDSHAADDSFQATFLVLVRRAQAIRRRESLGPWLHGVARRVALRARAADSVRREREARVAIDPAAAVGIPSPVPMTLARRCTLRSIACRRSTARRWCSAAFRGGRSRRPLGSLDGRPARSADVWLGPATGFAIDS